MVVAPELAEDDAADHLRRAGGDGVAGFNASRGDGEPAGWPEPVTHPDVAMLFVDLAAPRERIAEGGCCSTCWKGFTDPLSRYSVILRRRRHGGGVREIIAEPATPTPARMDRWKPPEYWS